MSKKSLIVSGAGFIGSLAGELNTALRERGVSDEEIHSLVVPGGKLSVGLIADNTVRQIRGEKNEFLKLVPGGDVEIAATTGQEPIWDETGLFSYVDPDIENWEADEKGNATPKTRVRTHEMIKDGTYAQLFGSLSSDLDRLCLTPAQIAVCIRNHRALLRADGYATFFLYKSKSNNQFFVADVHVNSDGLEVHVYRFAYSHLSYTLSFVIAWWPRYWLELFFFFTLTP